MVEFPESLESLLEKPAKRKITAVLKRDDTRPVRFDLGKIVDAVGKAASASGINYSEQERLQFAEEVERKLGANEDTFKHSGKAIPAVEDIQDTVEEVFDETNAERISRGLSEEMRIPYEEIYPYTLKVIKGNGDSMIDPTGYFYKRYRDSRARVRERLIHLPVAINLDSTDKQLLIHKVDSGTAYTFNFDALAQIILERTNVSFDDAEAAVKRTEQVLALRKTDKPVSTEEITSIVDLALMERGYEKDDLLNGRKVNIGLDDVDQIIFKKSVENSNIQANNPEAVNLGIAELALKEYAFREVYDNEVAEAHRKGIVHVHDSGYPTRVYCSAHSIEYIKKHGLDEPLDNLDAKSSKATKPTVLNNHIHTFLAAIQSSYAGALGFPMVNTLYAPYMLRDVEMVEGYEIAKDEQGREVKIKKRLERGTLEELVKDKAVNVFEETSSTRILRLRSKEEMKEIAQNLIFGASQSAFSRGGQTLFIDFNVDSDIPDHLVEVPAMFPKAEFVEAKQNERGEWEIVNRGNKEPQRYEGLTIDKGHGLEADSRNGDVIQPENGTMHITYGHPLVRKALRSFAEAIFEVAKEGDKYGNPFNFPKIDFHVGRRTFEEPESEELLRKACEVVEHNDSIYFMFDRGDGMNVAQCCRLRERITDPNILKHPEKMRFCGFQNVTINLPQAAYKAGGENLEERTEAALEEIDKAMLVALKAHTNKRRYIQRLLDTDGSPLRSMGKPSADGEPYIDLNKATYIIGFAGLNEMVQDLSGKELHEDAEAYKLGLKILSHMYSVKSMFTEKYGMKFVIEETPGESANRRLAKIDLLTYPEQAEKILKGDIEGDGMYYTNSGHLRADAPVSGLDRAILQGKMNPIIEAGAITHEFTGEKENRAAAVYDFVKAMYFNTQSSQVVFSGEHSICTSCGYHSRGLLDKCPECGNEEAEKIVHKTRVVGYFSNPDRWHKSKEAELKARQKATEFYAGERGSVKDLEAELL